MIDPRIVVSEKVREQMRKLAKRNSVHVSKISDRVVKAGIKTLKEEGELL